MSIPIKFASLESNKFKEVKALFDKIDSCDNSDLKLIENLRNQVMDNLGGIYESQKSQLDKMVTHIQSELKSKIKSNQFQGGQLLAVRSSSTLEDLDKMAGAGLFDSILNVKLDDP